MEASNQIWESISANFKEFELSLNGTRHSAIHVERQKAFKSLKKFGLPHKKHEEYRYLDLSGVTKSFKPAIKPQLEKVKVADFLVPKLKANVLVFIDGFFDPLRSSILDEGDFTIMSLKDSPEDLVEEYFGHYEWTKFNPFASLNISFAQQGGFVHIPKGKHIEHPVLLLNLNSGTNLWSQPHHIVVADDHTEVKIIEAYYGLNNGGIDNTFIRIFADENAIVDHYKIQAVGPDAYHFGTTHIMQEKEAVVSTSVYNLGGGLVRNNIHIELDDERTESNMYGLYVAANSDVIDNHTLVDHKHPNCESNELYKGIITDTGQGVFNGKIFVQRDAQQTNAFQSNRNLLLSDDATIYTKPQLEIWADDVKCSHGATIGKLNEDELFYLRARGIHKQKARQMLTYAFANEVLNTIKIPELKSFISEGVAAKLGLETDEA